MEEKETTTLFQHAMKWGLIAGAVSIAITTLLYVVDYTFLVNFKTALLMFAVFIGVAVYGGINYRNEIGGFLPYGKAFQHGFVLMAISGLVGLAFNFLMYTVIDPELPSKLTDASLENAQAMMESFGMPADQMDEALEQARERTENQFAIGGMAMGYGIGLIIYAVLALITAIFVRRNPPEEMI